jgi:DNA repair exonuclease SbcCD ATPase subunit
LDFRNRRLESEVSKLDEENQIKTSIIKRLEGDFEVRVSRVKEEFSKSPNVSKEALEDNRKLQDKIRALERDIAAEKAGVDRAKKELERNSESQKRDNDRELERRERELKDSNERAKKEVEREVNRVKAELEKIKREKERLEVDLAETKRKSSEEIKNIREVQMSSASDKYNQLLNENVELRRRSDGLEAEYDKLKKGALENNSANDREIARLRTENEKLTLDKKDYEKQKKQGFLDLPQETQIINRNIELEKKLKTVEADLERLKTKDEASIIEIKSLKEKVKKLEIELEIARKEIEAAQKSRLQATTYQSGFKPTVSIVENVEGSVVRSPRSPGFKSGSFDKGYMSPQESSLSREERIEEFGSSSSRVSQSSEDQGLPAYYSSQMTLREFIDAKHGDEKERDMYVTLVMIKVIEKIEE